MFAWEGEIIWDRTTYLERLEDDLEKHQQILDEYQKQKKKEQSKIKSVKGKKP